MKKLEMNAISTAPVGAAKGVRVLLCASAVLAASSCGVAGDNGDPIDESVNSTENAIATVLLEAEGMGRTGAYVTANAIAASNGQFVRLSTSGATGTLTKAFTGQSGKYDIYVRHFDENDGKSRFVLRVGGVQVARWVANENRASADSSALTRMQRLVASNLDILSGSSVELVGTGNANEFAPIDFIEFVPVSTNSGIATRPNNSSCVAPPRPAANASLEFQRYGSNLTFNLPMRVDQPKNDPAGDRLYVAEREGKVWSIPRTGTVTNGQRKLEFTLGSIPGALDVVATGEGGLLGMAFHPNFASNGHLFLSYTTSDPTGKKPMRSVIARVTKNFNTTTWGNYRVVLGPFLQPAPNHNGGDLRFGPLDGYLYASFGDGGAGGDKFANGKRHESFFSKILRIDVSTTNTGEPYRVPTDNPWPSGQNGFQPEAFAYGFRNPFRFGIDRQTGQVWVGDVGQDKWEEIDVVTKGGYYGWNTREGAHCFEPSVGCSKTGLIDPIFDYPHESTQTTPPSTVTGKSVVGGTTIRNASLGTSVQGAYVFADFISKQAWMLRQGPVKVTELPIEGGKQQFVAIDTDVDGDIYGVALVSGEIYRLQKATGNNNGPADYPATLSDTGCFGADPRKPSPSLIPYEINSPLWSDGSEKERFIAIPNGSKIEVGNDGDLVFPPGSVTVKTFTLGGRRIETRFFVRHQDGGWEGYTYEWNDAQTQATLLKTSKEKTVNNQMWYFPSRSDCASCHTDVAGGTLGPEIKQLNRNFRYPSSGINTNQIETWKKIGLFAAPLATAASLGAYPDPFGSAPVAARAASYLEANCSMCHRPNGGGPTFDARFEIPFGAGAGTKQMCNVIPADSLGIADARIVAPGSPPRSVLLQRMMRTNGDRMPPVASKLVHAGGTDLMWSWISSLDSCP